MAWTQATWDAEDWRNDAACRNVDATMFFPIGTSGAAIETTLQAKAVCETCAVAQECLIFAVTTNQEYGVWGGLDEEERREVRRQWRRASRSANRQSASAAG